MSGQILQGKYKKKSIGIRKKKEYIICRSPELEVKTTSYAPNCDITVQAS